MRQLTLILTLMLSLTACDFKSANDYLAEGDRLADEGKYEESSIQYTKAIEKDKKLLAAYINRGGNKSEQNDLDGALQDYWKVLEYDSLNTTALFNIGNAYGKLKEYQKAIHYYDKALETKGSSPFYVDAVPNAVVNVNEYDVPAQEIFYERGVAYYQIDSLQRAYDNFSAAKSKKYMTAECCYWIGYIHTSMGQMDEACENFRKAAKLGDKDAEEALNEFCGK